MNKLSKYTESLSLESKEGYKQKISLIGIDPFVIAETNQRSTVSPAAITMANALTTLPAVDGSDLVSYLVLQTSFVTAKQFKAHKSMEAYNQFVCGWVHKGVKAWNVCGKCVVTGKVSTLHQVF